MKPFRIVPMPLIDAAGGLCMVNDTYTVIVTPIDGLFIGPVHLSIKRNDKDAIHDWRDLQLIKNAMVGREREAIEIYPAESRLVDEANQYHLWVLPEGSEIPYGFNKRTVGSPEDAAKVRARQRPWKSDEIPEYTPVTDEVYADIRRPQWQ